MYFSPIDRLSYTGNPLRTPPSTPPQTAENEELPALPADLPPSNMDRQEEGNSLIQQSAANTPVFPHDPSLPSSSSHPHDLTQDPSPQLNGRVVRQRAPKRNAPYSLHSRKDIDMLRDELEQLLKDKWQECIVPPNNYPLLTDLKENLKDKLETFQHSFTPGLLSASIRLVYKEILACKIGNDPLTRDNRQEEEYSLLQQNAVNTSIFPYAPFLPSSSLNPYDLTQDPSLQLNGRVVRQRPPKRNAPYSLHSRENIDMLRERLKQLLKDKWQECIVPPHSYPSLTALKKKLKDKLQEFKDSFTPGLLNASIGLVYKQIRAREKCDSHLRSAEVDDSPLIQQSVVSEDPAFSESPNPFSSESNSTPFSQAEVSSFLSVSTQESSQQQQEMVDTPYNLDPSILLQGSDDLVFDENSTPFSSKPTSTPFSQAELPFFSSVTAQESSQQQSTELTSLYQRSFELWQSVFPRHDPLTMDTQEKGYSLLQQNAFNTPVFPHDPSLPSSSSHPHGLTQDSSIQLNDGVAPQHPSKKRKDPYSFHSRSDINTLKDVARQLLKDKWQQCIDPPASHPSLKKLREALKDQFNLLKPYFEKKCFDTVTRKVYKEICKSKS